MKIKRFVDTSVLIPVFIPGHEHHQRSLTIFLQSDNRDSACAVHSLAEVYATLTRLPARHRASAEQTLLFLDEIEARFSPVGLEVSEYKSTIREMAALGVVGGTCCDGLVGACARKVEAEVVYTWNLRHFLFLGPEIASRVRTP